MTTAATTTTPVPREWRESSAPPPRISRRGALPSSLLWGWGDKSGEDTHRSVAAASSYTATAASPVPYVPCWQGDKHVRGEDSVRDSYVNSAHASCSAPSALSASHSPPAAPAARRDAAYEEVREDQSSQSWRQPLRRPPLVPSPPCAASTTTPPTVSADPVVHPSDRVQFASCLNADDHAANIRCITHYLKNYYAREAGEVERGVESLSAEDVAGLAQCFYIDVYRTVRQARREVGLETSSFLVEDPTENIIASVAPEPPSPPPAPPQRERHDNFLPQQQCTTTAGAQTQLADRSATPDKGPIFRAPNSQLAFNDGGTHSAQIIMARLPAFRNNDITTAGGGSSVPGHLRSSAMPSVSPGASSTASASRAHKEARACAGPSGSNAAGARVPPHNLDSESAGPTSVAQMAAPSPPPPHMHQAVATAGVAPQCATVQHHQSLSCQPRTAFEVSQHRLFSGPNGRVGSPAEPSSSARLKHRQGATNNSEHHNHHGRQGVSLHTCGRDAHMRDGYVDSSSSSSSSGKGGDNGDETGRVDGRRNSGGGVDRAKLVASQPSSGIVKRPLKDLMPLLRSRVTLAVKHTHNSLRPHLRLFQILDCMDTYRGREVLMPHFTWATPAEAHRQDRLLPATRSKHGAPLPTGLSLSQQEVPYECALNLIHLEAVYVGAGRGIPEAHMTLFRRAKCGVSSHGINCRVDGGAAVIDHRGCPVPNDMCAVFVFASRPVAVCFMREADRQAWVGAMMGVVERNRTLKA
ncbi:hypothetical protein, conserved [Leishmania tarentolae]|uniref:PH-like domain-containing protein n=1 Tax=Leishmania tarentolae TaxID=5689 RepID=A0A640KAC6_LEITA|nr:hypothetical protein, conserved [Leishmania tarentolae]